MSIAGAIRTYDEFIAALRGRADELDVSRETIDAISGMQAGYASKLLARVPIRTLSRMSFGAMLGALGIVLHISNDIERLGKIEKHLAKRKRHDDTDDTIPTRKRRKNKALRGCSEWGKLMRARAVALQSPVQRSRMARHAIRARWRKRKMAATP